MVVLLTLSLPGGVSPPGGGALVAYDVWHAIRTQINHASAEIEEHVLRENIQGIDAVRLLAVVIAGAAVSGTVAQLNPGAVVGKGLVDIEERAHRVLAQRMA